MASSVHFRTWCVDKATPPHNVHISGDKAAPSEADNGIACVEYGCGRVLFVDSVGFAVKGALWPP